MIGSDPVLDVRKLIVEFSSEDGPVRAVDEVSFQVRRGEIVGLVGESGAGKSLTSEAFNAANTATAAKAQTQCAPTTTVGGGETTTTVAG